jgi:hypothetical protein
MDFKLVLIQKHLVSLPELALKEHIRYTNISVIP